MAQYCLEMHVTTKSQTYLMVASNRFDTLVKQELFGCLVWPTAIILPGNACYHKKSNIFDGSIEYVCTLVKQALFVPGMGNSHIMA